MSRRCVSLASLALLFPTTQSFAAPDLQAQARQAITKAVDFLLQVQQPDGAFRIYECRDAALTECSARSATTPTAVVLTGVSAVSDPRTTTLVERGASWLQAQMDAEGFFHCPYLGSPLQYTARPPTHIATTCLNRSVLEALGISVPPMTPDLARYQTTDGVFHPFTVPPEDVVAIQAGGIARERFEQSFGPAAIRLVTFVDSYANAEAFAYLTQHGHAPAALCDYLVRAAQQEQVPENPIFVESLYLLPYTVSRAYAEGASCLGPAKAALQSRLLAAQGRDGSWGSALDTALAAASLMRFGYDGAALDRAIQSLLQAQQPDGSWHRAVRGALRLKPVWRGSEEISTGYVLEALGMYLTARRQTTL